MVRQLQRELTPGLVMPSIIDRFVDNIFPFYRPEVIEDNLRACYPPPKHYQYINLLNAVNQL